MRIQILAYVVIAILSVRVGSAQDAVTAFVNVNVVPMDAERVLAAFGRAFGCLPEQRGELAIEQKNFLKQAVAELSEEGKVVCVRLALFAEMVRDKK